MMIRSNTVQLQKRVSFNAMLLAVCFHYTSYKAKEKRKNNFLRGDFYFQNLIATISNATPATKPKPTFTCGVQNVPLEVEEKAPTVSNISKGTPNLARPPKGVPLVLSAFGVSMVTANSDDRLPSKTSPFLKLYFSWKFAIFDIGGTMFVPDAVKSCLNLYLAIGNKIGWDKCKNYFTTFYSFEKTERALAKLFFLFSHPSYDKPCYEARHIANNSIINAITIFAS